MYVHEPTTTSNKRYFEVDSFGENLWFLEFMPASILKVQPDCDSYLTKKIYADTINTTPNWGLSDTSEMTYVFGYDYIRVLNAEVLFVEGTYIQQSVVHTPFTVFRTTYC